MTMARPFIFSFSFWLPATVLSALGKHCALYLADFWPTLQPNLGWFVLDRSSAGFRRLGAAQIVQGAIAFKQAGRMKFLFLQLNLPSCTLRVPFPDIYRLSVAMSHAPPNWVFSVFSFIGFILCCIPFPWHIAGN
jgi:hypothetical protein